MSEIDISYPETQKMMIVFPESSIFDIIATATDGQQTRQKKVTFKQAKELIFSAVLNNDYLRTDTQTIDDPMIGEITIVRIFDREKTIDFMRQRELAGELE